MRGRPPKIKLHQPTPDTPTKLPTCPRGLDPIARKKWKSLLKSLPGPVAMAVEPAMLESYCILYSQVQRYTADIETTGDVIEDDRGNMKANPLIRMRHNAMELMNGIMRTIEKTKVHAPAPPVKKLPVRDRGESSFPPPEMEAV